MFRTQFIGSILWLALFWPGFLEAQSYVFGPNVWVSDSTSSNKSCIAWKHNLAVRGDTVYAVWEDDREGALNQHTYFAKSTNRGDAFLPNVRVDDDPTGTNGQSTLYVDAKGWIHVAWVSRLGLRYARSTDGGGLIFSERGGSPGW